jgi:SAM-dependent methyltransferase
MACRVCGSSDIKALPIGKYAEFFSLRVDTRKDDFLVYVRGNFLQISPAPLLIRALRRIGRLLRGPKVKPVVQFRTNMQACAVCHGVTPCHEYSFEDLQGIYRDYRSETYNKDRISVEPGYALIAKDVGNSSLEIANRNAAVDRFLGRNASHFSGGVMIDYGGSDGRFIPSFAYAQFECVHIYDASDAALHRSVDIRKVRRIAAPCPGSYKFLTCMHVLEHVGSPRELVGEMARLLEPGGLIYIEVPLELSKSIRDAFEQKIIDPPILIHEHVNIFDRTSICALIHSVEGLELVDDAEDVVDQGWIQGLNGRFLARKVK